jgi:hypothetical protein
MESKLTLDEQTLLAMFRSLDDLGKRELLRHASQQHKMEEVAAHGLALASGQCRLERGEDRPEIAAEPIFTE